MYVGQDMMVRVTTIGHDLAELSLPGTHSIMMCPTYTFGFGETQQETLLQWAEAATRQRGLLC